MTIHGSPDPLSKDTMVTPHTIEATAVQISWFPGQLTLTKVSDDRRAAKVDGSGSGPREGGGILPGARQAGCAVLYHDLR